MQKKVNNYIRKWNMLSPQDTVIAGISGGADSVCLFYILKELTQTLGIRLIAVHINHGLRGDAAEADEAYVTALCRDNDVPLECSHIDIKAFARAEKLSEEEAGRVARRHAFGEALEKYGGTKIALAHHKDDNAETFLLHAARGSRLKGLGGIYPVNGVYIRPLLCVERREIEAYLKENGIDYCIDASNAEDTYTRNRIRNHVLPYFTKYINERTTEHLNGAMEQLRELQGFMQRQTREASGRCVSWSGEGVFIDKAFLDNEDSLLQTMVIWDTLTTLCGREKDIQEVHVQMLLDLLEKQTGREMCLPYRMRALRTYGGLCIQREDTRSLSEQEDSGIEAGTKGRELILPVKVQPAGSAVFGKLLVSWKVLACPGSKSQIPKKTYTKWFDYDIIKNSISVRTRRAGDRIAVDRRGSEQKLKSYFINEKIPSAERDRIPLMAEGQEILWIAGHRQSMAYQVTDRTTAILEISINGGTCNGGDN